MVANGEAPQPPVNEVAKKIIKQDGASIPPKNSRGIPDLLGVKRTVETSGKATPTPKEKDAETAVTDEVATRNLVDSQSVTAPFRVGPIPRGPKDDHDVRDDDPRKHST